jgi:hypothetical protein
MDKVNYYCYRWGSLLSGGGIFDTNLVAALGAQRDVVEVVIPVSRKWVLPIWDKHLGQIPMPPSDAVNVVSHEGLHDLLDTVPVDCFIVHNYFTEFDFPRLKVINPLYRLGSDKVFFRIFSESRRVVFLSAREKRLASERYPEFAQKFSCNPPGHNAKSAYFNGTRDGSLVEMPGTLDWVPKKLSYWLNIGSGLPIDGELVRGESPGSFISVVYDSFLSGFKLKLVEMAKHGKSIISFCDVEEELLSIGFEDLPYRFVESRLDLGEAIKYFRRQGDLSEEDRQAFYRRGSAISWANVANSVLG